jgi:acyl carrier protein
LVANDAFDRQPGQSGSRGDDAGHVIHLEVRERLLKLLATTLAPENVPPVVDDATGLLGHGIGLDSIEVLNLVGAIEEAFGITVDDDDLDPVHFQTVGSLVVFIQARLPA